MVSKDPRQQIAINGRAKDIAFLLEIFRQRGIPFRQAPTFGHGPVICIPLSHEAQLRAILEENKTEHPVTIITPEELASRQNTFWVMLWGGLAILSLPWLRLLLHHR